MLELGPNVDYGANTVAGMRLFRQIGAPVTDPNAQIGDLAVGGTITLGNAHPDGSSDDWFRSDYLVLWGFNPVLSRIPDAHFVPEARYGGTQVVTIAPDYSQCAIHSDLYLSPRPGTDAALALAACQVVIEEGLYEADYLREQTDLPFLIRSDSGRFLREADVVTGGRDDRDRARTLRTGRHRGPRLSTQSARANALPGRKGNPQQGSVLPRKLLGEEAKFSQEVQCLPVASFVTLGSLLTTKTP